jgi:Domain of unknown function (DUF5916)/Carbohydrate family 9 binding domain-like
MRRHSRRLGKELKLPLTITSRKKTGLLGACAGLLLLVLCLCAGAAQAQDLPVASATPLLTAAVPASATPTPNPPKSNAAAAAVGSSAIAKLPPEKTLPTRIPRFEQAPVIDGRLDDAVWKTAAVLRDFYQTNPGDNIAPSKPTEVLLGYDSKYLYIAFRCFDDPSKVRATIAKRDEIFDDDNVGIYLDTFNDQRKAYVLAFNPLGIQADGIHTEGSGGDFSVDLVMQSKGVITNDGYTVEVAIPFTSLRYEAGEGKLWGVHFLRQIKHLNDETDSWMPLARDSSSLLSQAGHITGLSGISGERTLEVIPTIALSERGRRVLANHPAATPLSIGTTLPATRFVNSPAEARPGLNVKYGFTPNITLNFTLNPDFGEIEADQPVVQANQRFPIFFPEKRPFFLEGIDIFQTPLTAVNTRAIISPDYAAKLTGKRGRNTFGLLIASDNAPGNFSDDERKDPANLRFLDKNAFIGILRLKRDIGKESSLGLIATSYDFVDDHNRLGGFDGRFRTNPQTVFTFQVLGTTSRRFFFDPDKGENVYRTGNALGYSYNYDYTGRNIGYTVFGEGRTRDYRADVGFTQRTNTNFEGFFLRLSTDPKPKALVIAKRLTNFISTNFDWQGRMQSWSNDTEARFDLARQVYFGFGFNGGYERLFEEEFGAKRADGRAGAFWGSPERATNRVIFSAYGGATPSQKYSANFYASYTRNAFDYDFGAGPRFPRVSPAALSDPNAALDPGVGDQLFLSASLNYQPTVALRTSVDYVKSSLKRADTGRTAFDENLFTLRTTYQFTSFTFARARLDYDTLASDIRGEFLLGWTPRPGTAFYIGYNNDLSRNGYNTLTNRFEPGLLRNNQTFFIKLSYLFRRSY